MLRQFADCILVSARRDPPRVDLSIMATLVQTIDILAQFAPPALAEDWDNVGLLVGDRGRAVDRLMTCLTLTPATVDEAVSESADLVVVHHPLPFRPVSRITSDSTVGAMLLRLIEARVAVYSPHTAFDSAREGINHHLAEALSLASVQPLVPAASLSDAELGAGRIGQASAPIRLADLAERLKSFLRIPQIRAVGSRDAEVSLIAVACGSGGTFLETAIEQHADCLITGETNFHTCLDAEARGVCLLLVGHYASERFAMDLLADFLTQELPDVRVWASRQERDPLHLL